MFRNSIYSIFKFTQAISIKILVFTFINKPWNRLSFQIVLTVVFTSYFKMSVKAPAMYTGLSTSVAIKYEAKGQHTLTSGYIKAHIFSWMLWTLLYNYILMHTYSYCIFSKLEYSILSSNNSLATILILTHVALNYIPFNHKLL